MKNFKLNDKILNLAANVEKSLQKTFEQIDRTYEKNENRVLNSFLECKVSTSHFYESTGYGYDDVGKNKLDELFSKIFICEDALVRSGFVSGTHAIAVALFAVLKPQDILLSITGTPYPTIRKTIGIVKSKDANSLSDYGIKYEEINIFEKDEIDLNLLEKKIQKNVKVIYIQRSKGYCVRHSISIEQIKKVADFVHAINKEIVVFVDNCYGEFVEEKEPTQVGADLMCGSLIKNPGGGVAKTGGYIAGKKNLIELCAQRFTAPGLGKEIGSNLSQNKDLFFGIFIAPFFVANALKTSAFARAIFEKMGFNVFPKAFEKTSDIVCVLRLNSKQKLESFCEGIQNNSPINSFFKPIPSRMPGYSKKIIMASGGFVSGASLELSADAEITPPYNVFLQGGLTYNSAKTAILKTIQKMENEKLLIV